MVDYEPNAETAPTHDELDLEDILKKTMSIEEDFKVGEILPRVVDALHEHTKYKDAQGVKRYKSNFSESSKEDLDKIADSIFDALVYHSHLLHFEDFGKDKFESLKEIKDAHGNLYTDTITQSHFGISRDALRKFISDSKDKITTEGIIALMKEPMQKYISRIRAPLLSKIQSEHLGYVKDFVKHKKLKHNLDGDHYDLSEIHEVGEPLYEKLMGIALDLYKKKEEEKK